MKKYLKVWFQLAHISFAEQISTRFNGILFLVGKIARFLFFFVFIFHLTTQTKGLGGYNRDQIMIFFLTFNLIDITTQMFFRGVYYFRDQVVSGTFDFTLVKPINTLFRVMSRQTDFFDLTTLIALVGFIAWFLPHSTIEIIPQDVLLFLMFLTLSFLIAFSFHVVVVAICIITTEVDHTIMIYRDLTQMGRIPIDVYAQPVRLALTYVIPIAIMITVPAQALLGLLSPFSIFISLLIVFCSLFFAFRFFRYSLSQYSSASS